MSSFTPPISKRTGKPCIKCTEQGHTCPQHSRVLGRSSPPFATTAAAPAAPAASHACAHCSDQFGQAEELMNHIAVKHATKPVGRSTGDRLMGAGKLSGAFGWAAHPGGGLECSPQCDVDTHALSIQPPTQPAVALQSAPSLQAAVSADASAHPKKHRLLLSARSSGVTLTLPTAPAVKGPGATTAVGLGESPPATPKSGPSTPLLLATLPVSSGAVTSANSVPPDHGPAQRPPPPGASVSSANVAVPRRAAPTNLNPATHTVAQSHPAPSAPPAPVLSALPVPAPPAHAAVSTGRPPSLPTPPISTAPPRAPAAIVSNGGEAVSGRVGGSAPKSDGDRQLPRPPAPTAPLIEHRHVLDRDELFPARSGSSKPVVLPQPPPPPASTSTSKHQSHAPVVATATPYSHYGGQSFAGSTAAGSSGSQAPAAWQDWRMYAPPYGPPPPSLCVCGSVGCFVCTVCSRQLYCSEACQRRDWPTHLPKCRLATFPAAASTKVGSVPLLPGGRPAASPTSSVSDSDSDGSARRRGAFGVRLVVSHGFLKPLATADSASAPAVKRKSSPEPLARAASDVKRPKILAGTAISP